MTPDAEKPVLVAPATSKPYVGASRDASEAVPLVWTIWTVAAIAAVGALALFAELEIAAKQVTAEAQVPVAPAPLIEKKVLPPAPQPAAVPPPSPPKTAADLPPLQEVQIGRVPVHAIPEVEGPARNVSPEVANGPRPLGSLGNSPIVAPKQFSGAAKVSGPLALVVGSVPVQLYGVKAPAPGDRCGMAGTDSCAALAQRTLSARANGTISCQSPAPKRGLVVAFAICLDAQGTDIAGALVSAGLALADSSQSYDYVGAESIARGQKRGLWAFRNGVSQ